MPHPVAGGCWACLLSDEIPRPSRVDSADLFIDTARFRRADQLAPGRVQINDSSVRIGHADVIARCLEDLYQTAPFFLGEANTLALGRLRKRASYCGSEPLQVVFQHVVGRAEPDRLDGPLLADRAGNKNERDARAHIPHHAQCLDAVKGRHGKV